MKLHILVDCPIRAFCNGFVFQINPTPFVKTNSKPFQLWHGALRWITSHLHSFWYSGMYDIILWTDLYSTSINFYSWRLSSSYTLRRCDVSLATMTRGYNKWARLFTHNQCFVRSFSSTPFLKLLPHLHIINISWQIIFLGMIPFRTINGLKIVKK